MMIVSCRKKFVNDHANQRICLPALQPSTMTGKDEVNQKPCLDEQAIVEGSYHSLTSDIQTLCDSFLQMQVQFTFLYAHQVNARITGKKSVLCFS